MEPENVLAGRALWDLVGKTGRERAGRYLGVEQKGGDSYCILSAASSTVPSDYQAAAHALPVLVQSVDLSRERRKGQGCGVPSLKPSSPYKAGSHAFPHGFGWRWPGAGAERTQAFAIQRQVRAWHCGT